MSSILKYCNEHTIGVVPQGGNTGLVGGSVSTCRNEIIISTEAMKHIISFDAIHGVLQCQSGCILQQLQDHVVNYNYLMPIDLGSKGSCTIGGNVSTNAGTFSFSFFLSFIIKSFQMLRDDSPHHMYLSDDLIILFRWTILLSIRFHTF